MTSEVLVGKNRRYHIESLVSSNSTAYIYRAYSRRKAGDGIKRRYYAIVTPSQDGSLIPFQSGLRQSMRRLPFPVRLEEEIRNEYGTFFVLAKGKPTKKHKTISKIVNKGYLMLFLAALILILIIIRFFS